MKVRVMINHGVDPELVDLLEKVKTTAAIEVVGPELILHDVDMTELQQDIMKVCREAIKINRVMDQVGYPWMARDILEGKAVIIEGIMVYKDPKNNPLRKKIEAVVGELTDQQYDEVLEIAAQDIEFNRVAFNKETTLPDIIKIAAQCAIALKRCGI